MRFMYLYLYMCNFRGLNTFKPIQLQDQLKGLNSSLVDWGAVTSLFLSSLTGHSELKENQMELYKGFGKIAISIPPSKVQI